MPTADPGSGVSSRHDGPVAVVTVDRQPVRNAFGPQTLLDLARILRRGVADGVRAIVLTGAGDVSFSSGMDLKAMLAGPREHISTAVAAFDRAMDADDRVPLIAAVNGAAIGGGFEVALRCDLVVAAEHAKFHLPEVGRGIVPGGGGTLLPARIPLAIALEIGLLGEPISAHRAFDLGLVNGVVPASELLDVAVDLGRRIARNGPRAVARTRRLMWMTAVDGAAAAWAETRRSFDDPALRKEMEEGVAAFVEKRSPRW